MVGCAAFGCSNRSEKGYHGFPKDQERREKWMAMVSRQNLLTVSNSQKRCNVMFRSLASISKGIIILSVENYDFSMIFEVQWKLILQAYLQVHFENDQFKATKVDRMLKLRPDAGPTVFIHRPKPKRRKPPSVRVPPEPSATDHTYCAKLNFGMIHAANNIPHFM